MKKRLIELIVNAPRTDVIYGNIKLDKPIQTAQTIADYLLDNGVIVPPCAVGDTVYSFVDMDNPARRMLESKVIDISINERGIKFQTKTLKKYLYRYAFYKIDDFGKTVFLTREEAEKALAERSEGK